MPSTTYSADTVPTGIPGLDEVLLGGVKQGNVLLVEGAPGVGKTTFGLQFIYCGVVDHNEPGLIVTFELSPSKLWRDAAGFGWDMPTLEKQGKLRTIYTSPSVLLEELQSSDGILLNEIRRIKAKRILVDGLTPLKVFGELYNGRPFRDSLHLLVEMLQREGVTALLTREAPESEEARSAELSHEQFICDTVITLRNEMQGRRRVRSVTVSKSRGQDFISGRHALRIEPQEGVRVYQRAQSRARIVTNQPTSTHRSSIGSEGLDRLLGGGVLDGSATLVVGVSGTGKTVLGMQFLNEGARQGKPGLMITLDEHPAQIVRNAAGLGLPLKKLVKEGRLIIDYASPQELELDVHFDHIIKTIEQNKIERVLVDSLAAYVTHNERGREFHDFLYALTTFFKDRGITAFMNYESPELLGVSQISEEIKASTIVDNIVLLNYVEFSNRLRRAITVPKARGSAPSRMTREFRIAKGGIVIENVDEDETESVPQLPFSAYYGILARSPARRSPLIEEQMMSGEPSTKGSNAATSDGEAMPVSPHDKSGSEVKPPPRKRKA